MAAAGFSEDEVRGAWNYARKAGFTEATGLGADRQPRLAEFEHEK